ncbi:hypothetical protein J4410_01300 [Candidatus Woesearchaeota archaeon]|nr:hypothetical protein [Candidatus Woesearchaeota archaeon]
MITKIIKKNPLEQETPETTYSMMVVEIRELDHKKLAALSPTDVLIEIGKTIESNMSKQDVIFSRYYSNHDLHMHNRMLMQITDSFVVVSPQQSKKQLAKTNKKITIQLEQAGIKVKSGFAEYGVDGTDSREVLAVATQQVTQPS